MNTYPNAKGGAQKLYKSYIIYIIAAIITIIASIATISGILLANSDAAYQTSEVGIFTGVSATIALVGAFVTIAAGILQILGILQASKDEDSFKTALIIFVLSIIVSCLAGIEALSGLKAIFTTVSTVLMTASGLLTIKGFCKLLEERGAEKTAQLGHKLEKLAIVIMVIKVAIDLVSLALPLAAALLVVVYLVIYMIFYFRMLGFLKRTAVHMTD
ncbi:MAG: hypothetical protein Q4E57_01190 [Eubacteriales bacterium]|nr:hypothetical protein [Eubacteriales bacterium]